MDFILWILLLTTTITSLLGLEVLRDDTKNGFIYPYFEDVHIKSFNAELQFQINIENMDGIKTKMNNLLNFCEADNFLINDTINRLFHRETYWLNLRPPKSEIINHLILLPFKPFEQLERNLITIFEPENKCDVIQNLTSEIAYINKRMNDIAYGSNIQSLLYIIPMEEFFLETRSHFENLSNENLILPFNYDHTFAHDFIQYTKYNYGVENKTVIITIKIPLFQKTRLFKTFSKPFNYKNSTIIYNLNTFFVSKENQDVLYTQTSYSNKCNRSNSLGKTLCNTPSISNICEKNLFVDDYNLNCFTVLPNDNIITKIPDNIFVMIKTPMKINIACNNKSVELHLNESKRIIDTENCMFDFGSLSFNGSMINNYALIKMGKPYQLYLIESNINKTLNWIIFLLLLCGLLLFISVKCNEHISETYSMEGIFAPHIEKDKDNEERTETQISK